jgi:broad specificity phosphatase PhoE
MISAGIVPEKMRRHLNAMTVETEDQSRLPGLTRVWLLRHAETANPTVFHGAESDIGLSDRGRRQVQQLAPWIARLKPQAIVSSAMLRPRLTAEPIAAACGLSLHLEPQLHERRVGALAGAPFQTGNGLWVRTLQRWMMGDTAYAPPGAESFDDIRGRVLPVWQRLTTDHAGRSFIVVAHGVVCKVLLMSLGTGLTPADWKRIGPIHNLALHELMNFGTGWKLVPFNEMPPVLVDTAGDQF